MRQTPEHCHGAHLVGFIQPPLDGSLLGINIGEQRLSGNKPVLLPAFVASRAGDNLKPASAI